MAFQESPGPDSSFATTFLPEDESNTDYFSQPHFTMYRQLAGGDPVIDFTVLSMAVVTMSLLLIVAMLRHQIDHIARGKEFFENVLEAAYHELSTLGIVEAVIFLVHHYYQDLNIEVERVFAEVHFTLFFVAIINAIMSCLLHFFATRVAEKQWVRLETIDIDHYVALRRQFDAMEENMKAVRDSEEQKKNYCEEGLHPAADDAHDTKQTNLFLKKLNNTRYPLLKASLRRVLDVKYKKLLIQVRFHELRLHFIESNQLDPKFRVSTYLKLCMNDVFKKLVHISTFSWLTLLACANLLYFITGVIASETMNPSSIGKTLSFVYVGYAMAFVLVSLLTGWKMKQIFFRIMKNEEWITRDEGDNQSARSARLAVAHSSSRVGNEDNGDRVHQRDHFWGGDPTNVVVLCQFMQFGYALALAVLLVFNKTIFVNETPFRWVGVYLVVPSVCYFLFVCIWSSVIPQYTQCTSLGELVDEKHLNDTRAMFELKEARSHRQDEIDFAEAQGKELPNSQKRRKKTARKKQDSMLKLNFFQKMIDGGVGEGSNRTPEVKDDSSLGNSAHSNGSQKLVQLSELVKMKSEDLPNIKPRVRRPRKRSASEGVAAMRMFSTTSAVAKEALMSEEIQQSEIQLRPPSSKLGAIDDVKTRPRPRRQKAVSTGVFMMQSEKSATLFDESRNEDSRTISDEDTKKEDVSIFKPLPSPSLKESLGSCLFPKKEQDKGFQNLPRALQQKKFITPIIEEEADDEISDSEDSITSFLSEGVPDIIDFDCSEDTKIFNFAELLRGLYVKKTYRLASSVFGTMVVFFMVAIRIELILFDICVITDNQNTWNFVTRQIAFWIVVVWLCIFITEGATQAIIFLKSDSNRHMVVAGLFDCAISITCLGIFLSAEVGRCCDCENTTSYRLLAETNDTYNSSCDKYHDCCPQFGDRLCGGVGTLEPFTAIIAFRLLRFAFAKRAFQLFHKKDPIQSPEINDECNQKASGDLQGALHLDGSAHAMQGTDFERTTGTIAQLWTAAVLKHPDIVHEYGFFSGFLLEAMLGIESAPSAQGAHEVPSQKKILSQTEQSLTPDTSQKIPSSFRRRNIYEKQMSKVSSEGSLGRNTNEDNEYNFIRPAAPLIRSMRRCQCKWLPLLDAWESVDVILTTYEIVWLGPKPVSKLWDERIDSKRDAIKNMIRSQQGGKGMSLYDVVVGREVLGRLPLSDIDQIKVQRLPPGEKHPSKRKGKRRDVEDVHETFDLTSEFWADSKDSRQTYKENATERWTNVLEDDLVLHSPQGTLCLRFLVDLLDEESKDETDMNIQSFGTKEGALLWCQTVSHLCGPQQLKQQLTHLGETRDQELLDFVEVLEPNKFNRTWRR